MADSTMSVDANWTVQHERRIAQPELMLVNGVISGDVLADLEATYPIAIPAQTYSAAEGTAAAGHCYCGKVKLELPFDLKPAISVICHCHDCREWHSVGSLPYMMFPLEADEAGRGIAYHIPIKVSFLQVKSILKSNRQGGLTQATSATNSLTVGELSRINH
jgi:hypothetical protein